LLVMNFAVSSSTTAWYFMSICLSVNHIWLSI
jgi:hypothetical protein